MSESQLTLDSIVASNLAHKIAESEHRSLREVVERALTAYANLSHDLIQEIQREPADVFYHRICRDYGVVGIDIAELADAGQRPFDGVEL
jgi:hypothetical protein